LATVVVLRTTADEEVLLESLPSVAKVTRRMVVEHEPLMPASVLRCHESRSTVLLNTVGRAQATYEMLRQELEITKSGVSLYCCTLASSNKIGLQKKRGFGPFWEKTEEGLLFW
jgi:hypothetical protein